MAAAEHRRLLEQLMGDSLNSTPSRTPQVAIDDPKVCRSYLVGDCPHTLFTNTKHDIGPCSKLHVEALKTEYQEAPETQKRAWGFEWDYYYDMKKHVEQCNRQIEVSQKRLEKTAEEIRKTDTIVKQINDLARTIECGLLEVKIMGEEGLVNLACMEMFKIRQSQQLKAEKERELKTLSDNSGSSGHQKLQVCDVCGAYLSRLDNDRRLADHFFGKMHLGFAAMRKAYDKLHEELKHKQRPIRNNSYDGGYNRGGGGGYGRGFRGGRGRGGGRHGGW